MSMFLDSLRSRNPAQYDKPTGFTENYQSGLGTMVETGLSISSLLVDITRPYRSRRDRQVDELLATSKLPKEYGDMLGHYMTYNDVAAAAREKFGLDIDTDKDIDDRIRADILFSDRNAQQVFEDASLAGKAGAVLGTLHGAMLDPITVVSSITGLGAAAKGATLLSRIAKAAGVAGAVSGAEELAMQPFVYNWKRDVGLDYSIQDSLKSIGYAIGGGGILGGAATTVKTAGEFAAQCRKFLSSHPVFRVKDKDGMTNEAYNMVSARVDEAECLPPDIDIQHHLAKVDGYIKQQDELRPVSTLTDKFDPEDATDEAIAKAFNSDAGPDTPYVKEVLDDQIVIGNAKVDVADLDTRISKLTELDKCLKGV